MKSGSEQPPKLKEVQKNCATWVEVGVPGTDAARGPRYHSIAPPPLLACDHMAKQVVSAVRGLMKSLLWPREQLLVPLGNPNHSRTQHMCRGSLSLMELTSQDCLAG